ncbi:hypothetical protein AAF712_003963 [Marasmius tenuissimus]|uniref:Uncharacterized protein n=1 Tax=Marasmius tenuissimus TaxID=585030 RepID=A0ABR3A4T3_9AGAR
MSRHTFEDSNEAQDEGWEIISPHVASAEVGSSASHEREDRNQHAVAGNPEPEVLSVVERQELIIDLGRYHIQRLTAESEEKDRQIQILRGQIARLRQRRA